MDRTQRTSRLGRIEYGRFLRAPATLDASHAAFAMNRAGPGHVDLATHFSRAVGLGLPRVGLSSAQQLLAAGTPFVYLTLTNDHQRPTEKAHDATLKWSRTLDGASGATVRLIGPPAALFNTPREGVARSRRRSARKPMTSVLFTLGRWASDHGLARPSARSAHTWY